ncbi:MAG: hypothetical protein HPY83_09330 [Anaerolineae bacterium]|nr:hypothetical protein [Anaerolineae bacterium]
MAYRQEVLPEEFALLWSLAMYERAGEGDSYQVIFEEGGGAALRGTRTGHYLVAAPSNMAVYRRLHKMGLILLRELGRMPPVIRITPAGVRHVLGEEESGRSAGSQGGH